jgi:hypothetical protein
MKAPDVATPGIASAAGRADVKSPQPARRSARITMAIPIVFFGQSQEGRVFGENCRTMNVSAHGAAILVSRAVDKNKPALIVNLMSKAEARSRVVNQRPEKGSFEVGIEFLEPNPGFWGMYFPPENTGPSERKRTTPTEANSAAESPSESKGPAK